MWERHWEFNTARFSVLFEVTACEESPYDSFSEREDADAIVNGQVEWFDARVRILLDGREIASDYLGCCSYYTVREFYEGHRDPDPMNRNSSIMRKANGGNVCICHYFPSMVSEAVRMARAEMEKMQNVRLRA